MPNPISENIAQIHASGWYETLAVAKWFAANAFIVVGGTFAAAFMILIFVIFVKALRGSNLSDLFVGERKGELSMTKFWTNVAYCAATIAFLALNLLNQESGDSVVMLWLIYLGTVGANAIASKWLALKYAPAGTTVVTNDPELRYPPPPAPAPPPAPPSTTGPSPEQSSQTVPGIVVSTQIGTAVPSQPGVTVSTPTLG